MGLVYLVLDTNGAFRIGFSEILIIWSSEKNEFEFFLFLVKMTKIANFQTKQRPLKKYCIGLILVTTDSLKNVDIFGHKKFEDCFIDSQEIVGYFKYKNLIIEKADL